MVKPNVTTMVIKVDLQCHKCCKKIKKVLCKFPQIRDQVYDEKKNTVTINVLCCSPEKIKQKICCKGGQCVKGIEIIVPKPPLPATDKPTPTAKPKDEAPKKTEPVDTPKPKETPKKIEPPPSQPPKVPVTTSPTEVCCTECSKGRCGGPCNCRCGRPPSAEKPPETAKPKETPKDTEPAPCYPPLVPVVAFPIGVCCTECSQGRGGKPCYRRCGFPPPPPAETPKKTEPVPCHPPLVPIVTSPIGVCCTECSQGRGGGPCYHGYGYPPPLFCEGYCGGPVYHRWGGGYRDGYYICEENASACAIM